MTGDSINFCTLLETRCQQQLKRVHSIDEDLNQMERALDSAQNVHMTLSAANLFTQELEQIKISNFLEYASFPVWTLIKYPALLLITLQILAAEPNQCIFKYRKNTTIKLILIQPTSVHSGYRV